jgi:hypothetical protein
MIMKQKSYLMVVTFAMSALALAAAGCSEDPDGGGGTGGGSGGSGGGMGGTSGGLGAIVGTPVSTFDADVNMFKMNDYADMMSTNLYAGMAVVPTHSTTEGSPTPGALSIVAPYTDYGQYAEFLKDFGEMTMQDWTGKTKLHVRVKIASGGNPDAMAPNGVIVFVQSAGFIYSGGTYTNVMPGNGWQDFTWVAPASPPTGFDISKIRLMGVQVTTGGGAAATKPTMAQIYVDSFSIE